MQHGKKIVAAWMIAGWLVAGLVSVGLAQDQVERKAEARGTAQPSSPAARAAEAPVQPADPARMEHLLQLWERQSSLLKTLDVNILRTDVNPAWDELEYYEGRAIFKSPNFAFIDFKKIKQDEKKKPIRDAKNGKFSSTDYERIICTGEEVWQYRSDTQQIFVFSLPKDEQKKAIEEGPLPFLFNMRADEAKKRYQMTLMSEDAKSYGVSIKPKLADDQESFSLAFVRLDRRFLLPVRIVLYSPDGKSKKDFQLGPVYPNAKVNDKNFEGRPLGDPWKVVRNPTGEERPRAGISRARRGGPAEAAPVRQGTAPGGAPRR